MEIQPIKTLEKVFKPVVAPYIGKIMKAIKSVGKLPAIAIKKAQEFLKSALSARETSLKNYISIGSYYVSKRFLLFAALLILVLIYFLFINPPAFVNKWFNRVPVLQQNTEKLSAFSGVGKVVDEQKHPLYVGEVKDGVYAGKGKLYDDQGRVVYEGDFDKGQKSGTGTLYDEGGNKVYQGAFAGDAFNGAGTQYFADQKVQYIGEFQNSKFGGAGKLFAPNGEILYEGGFNAGLYNGAGKLFAPGGTVIYDGEFAAGAYNGAGKLFNDQGVLIYEGGFKNGLYSGDGKQYYANGFLKYEGQFLAGAYNGAGTAFDDKGIPRYKGAFQNGSASGAGEAYDETGKLLYQGQFQSGVYDGLGTLFDTEGVPVLKSFFAGGEVSLQSFIGLPSKKIEDLLGKPGEVTMLDDSVLLAGQEAAFDASGSAPAALPDAGASAAATAAAADASAAETKGSGVAGETAGPPAVDAAAGVKLLLTYPDYQLSFLVEPSAANPKEAIVTSLSIWGSKPLSVLQPLIETMQNPLEPNEQGYRIVELGVPVDARSYTNSYFKSDYIFTFTHFQNEKAAHLLQVYSYKP